MSQPLSEPSRIERDLDQTRSRLGSHLSELQDRLSPGQVLDDIMGYFRGSEGAAFGANLVDSLRANPVPAAITGIGLAWLMAAGPRAGRAAATPLPHYGRDDFAGTMSRVQAAEASVTRGTSEDDHAYSARLDQARGTAIGLAQHAQETASSFSDRVRDALASAKQSMTAKVHDLGDRVSGAVGQAGDTLSAAGRSMQESAQGAVGSAGAAMQRGQMAAGQAGSSMLTGLVESPVLLGALGLAAGALLGALLPHSEMEENALGGIAGQARDTVTSLAKEGMERGKHVAQAVTDTARDSAQQQGLTGGRSVGALVDAALSGELAGQAKQVAQNVLHSGEDAIRKEVPQAG